MYVEKNSLFLAFQSPSNISLTIFLIFVLCVYSDQQNQTEISKWKCLTWVLLCSIIIKYIHHILRPLTCRILTSSSHCLWHDSWLQQLGRYPQIVSHIVIHIHNEVSSFNAILITTQCVLFTRTEWCIHCDHNNELLKYF